MCAPCTVAFRVVAEVCTVACTVVHRCAPSAAAIPPEPKIVRRTQGEVSLSLHSSERRNFRKVRRAQAEVCLSALHSEPPIMRNVRRTQAEGSLSLESSARPMMRNFRRPQAEEYEILPNSPPAYIFEKHKYERQTRKTNTKIASCAGGFLNSIFFVRGTRPHTNAFPECLS